MPDEQLLNFCCIQEHAEGRVDDYKGLDNWSLSGLMQKMFQEGNAEG